jgi:uncharacterized phiE125 gp8 family phage protein
MKVIVIQAPQPVVSKEEAKRHLLVEHSDDDTFIEVLIAAATTWIDGPAGWLGRALGVQVLEWQRCDWPCEGEPFPYPPEIELVSIGYVDRDGAEQEWTPPSPLQFDSAPPVRGRSGDVKIRYRAGYGSASGDPVVWTNNVPAPIKVAILMLVAQWYRTRAPVSIGAAVEELPFGVEALLSPYRVYR